MTRGCFLVVEEVDERREEVDEEWEREGAVDDDDDDNNVDVEEDFLSVVVDDDDVEGLIVGVITAAVVEGGRLNVSSMAFVEAEENSRAKRSAEPLGREGAGGGIEPSLDAILQSNCEYNYYYFSS